MNSSHPLLSFLHRHFALPTSALPLVESVLATEERGGTACRWEGDLPEGAAWISPAGREVTTPLVWQVWQGERYVQSARWWRLEHELAAAWMQRAAQPVESFWPSSLATEILGSNAPTSRQGQALECANTRALALITGGPGTGKTYILARILACLLQSGALAAAEIALAAPTGKAAERMRVSLAEAAAGLPAGWAQTAENLLTVGQAARTLHALLGVRAHTGAMQYDRQNPGPWRLLVVDEASMVEASLWQAVLRALQPQSRLIVLGDPFQLESVGPGQVLADLVRAARLPGHPLAACHVELTEARRFAGYPGIVRFANALRQADADEAARCLDAAREVGGEAIRTAVSKGLRWIEWTDNRPFPVEKLPPDVWESLLAVTVEENPAQALEKLAQIGVLSPQREFPVGARAISVAIEQELHRRCSPRMQPITILRNDATTGLRNGSVGVIRRSDSGREQLAFFSDGSRGADGTSAVRSWPVEALPDFASAWCATVHRAQGSEYTRVVVFVPRRESPLATRELLYTAITRAREEVILIGAADSVRAAAAAGPGRTTLLEAALQGPGDT